jgi:hypothetical protein
MSTRHVKSVRHIRRNAKIKIVIDIFGSAMPPVLSSLFLLIFAGTANFGSPADHYPDARKTAARFTA